MLAWDRNSRSFGAWMPLLGMLLWCLLGSSQVWARDGHTFALQPPQGPLSTWGDSVGHGHNFESQGLGPAGPSEKVSPAASCQPHPPRGIRPPALVGFLKAQNFSCLRFLWSYDQDVAALYQEPHMIAVYQAIARLAQDASVHADTSLHKLLFFVRVGHYHAFYQRFDFDGSVEEAAVVAFDALRPRVNRASLKRDLVPWLDEWVNAVDGASLPHRYLDATKHLLRAFLFDQDKRYDKERQRSAYSVLTAISRQVGNRYPAFLAVVDGDLVDLLRVVALKSDLLEQADYILNAAVWALGRIGPLPSYEEPVVEALQQITRAYGPRGVGESYEAPYLWVLQALDKYLRCPIGGITICKKDLLPELETKLFPYRYSFDDGAMIFETSLSLDEIQPLYHAAKEVHAQFSRVTGNLRPVPRDSNCTLRIKIYGSKGSFTNYHWFLYDLPTDNGGIYIEQHGVFYTFQRTARQSRYSLEELFRHEFVHYLVGRYLIAGLWGETELYRAGRMVWFDEGFAEFLTWSSSNNGVRVRRSLVNQIERDKERLTLEQILESRYGDFKFYRYAGLLFNYLYETEPRLLRALLEHIRTADVEGLDRWIQNISGNRQVAQAYQKFLDDQVAERATLDDPRTHFPEPAILEIADSFLVEAALQRIFPFSHVECRVMAQTVNRRFACRNELVGELTTTKDYEAAWREFDRSLNEAIDSLRSDESPNNFQAMNCHLGSIRFREEHDNQFYPLAMTYCEGPLAQQPSVAGDPSFGVTRDCENRYSLFEEEDSVLQSPHAFLVAQKKSSNVQEY